MKTITNATSILLVYTGGTIGMIENPVTGALENFSFEQLKKHVPELQKFDFNIDSCQFDHPMDSSDMDAKAWRMLVDIIQKNYDKYTGFVVLHGTDTMAFCTELHAARLVKASHPYRFTTADRRDTYRWQGKPANQFGDSSSTQTRWLANGAGGVRVF